VNLKNSLPYGDYRILVDLPARQAALGFDDYARALAHAIETSRPQFAVGIFGTWGSGKTTLMKAVERQLDAGTTIPVEFSAWRYEKEQHLLIPLLDTIREAMMAWSTAQAAALRAPAPQKAEKVVQVVTSAARTVGKVITSLLAGISLKVGLPNALEFSYEASKSLASSKEGVSRVKSWWSAGKAADVQRQVTDRADPEFPQSIYHACFRKLKEAFDSLRHELVDVGDIRIVVFVDDLDRCLPQGALEVLEAIKLFFELEGFIFVVGLDRSVVERFIESRYAPAPGPAATPVPSYVSGADYIKKIFQVPVTLAPVQLAQLGELLNAIELDAELAPSQAEDLRERVRRHLEVALSDTDVNPREVKRYINSYVLQMKIKSHLNPSIVLALQTIGVRRDWEAVYQALAAYRDEFVDALQRQTSGGEPSALADLDPELANLPPSFLQYVDASGPARELTQVVGGISEYLYSGEATTSSHGPVLLEVLRFLNKARRALDEEKDAPGAQKASAARESLIKARSHLGNLESFVDIRTLAQTLSQIESDLAAPTADVAGAQTAAASLVTGSRSRIEEVIRRVRELRRRDRIDPIQSTAPNAQTASAAR
jgi:hypothetical protein